MASLPSWLPILLDRISWGCSTSPWFANLADDEKIVDAAKENLTDLWPFIKDLPTNIGAVREKAPPHMEAAQNLLQQLADDERHYQQLFIRQCYLAGLDERDLVKIVPGETTRVLCEGMKRFCQESSYVDGVHAIVAAEMAATLYSRAALPHYDSYFERHPEKYSTEVVEDGLEWLRLHAKPHTRHALWMKRMLGDIENKTGNEIPEGADVILAALLKLWQCPTEETKTSSDVPTCVK
ncbi:MAG: hypothetical protein U0105_25595 [Candidatus Obscuribacterales bacterium]